MKSKTLIKILLSVLFLSLILKVTDFNSLKSVVSSLHPVYVVLVIFSYLFGQVFSAIKWWIIARSAGINVNFGTAFRAYFTGMFVNVLGVGTVGGDVTRGILIAEGNNSKTIGIASVVADRLHGLAVLAMIGLSAILFFGSLDLDPIFTYLLALFAFGVIVGWFVGPSLLLRFLPSESKFTKKVKEVSEVFPREKKVVITITLISTFFHLLQIFTHKLMGYSVGIDLPLSYLLVACPFANIVSTLPISWQGLGVRENAYKFFFVNSGILTNAQAVTFGAIWFLAMTISGCFGGLVVAFGGGLEKLGAGRMGLEKTK